MSTSRARSVLGPTAAGLLIAAVKLGILTIGVSRTLRMLEWSTRGVPRNREPGAEDLTTAARNVAVAAALYPGRALCLQQSLVLHFSLRRAGIDARHRIGVRGYPFTAHAWVEVQGEPVSEDPDFIQTFSPLARPAS